MGPYSATVVEYKKISKHYEVGHGSVPCRPLFLYGRVEENHTFEHMEWGCGLKLCKNRAYCYLTIYTPKI